MAEKCAGFCAASDGNALISRGIRGLFGSLPGSFAKRLISVGSSAVFPLL
jgi:hypothetical protein